MIEPDTGWIITYHKELVQKDVAQVRTSFSVSSKNACDALRGELYSVVLSRSDEPFFEELIDFG